MSYSNKVEDLLTIIKSKNLNSDEFKVLKDKMVELNDDSKVKERDKREKRYEQHKNRVKEMIKERPIIKKWLEENVNPGDFVKIRGRKGGPYRKIEKVDGEHIVGIVHWYSKDKGFYTTNSASRCSNHIDYLQEIYKFKGTDFIIYKRKDLLRKGSY